MLYVSGDMSRLKSLVTLELILKWLTETQSMLIPILEFYPYFVQCQIFPFSKLQNQTKQRCLHFFVIFWRLRKLLWKVQYQKGTLSIEEKGLTPPSLEKKTTPNFSILSKAISIIIQTILLKWFISFMWYAEGACCY